MKRVSSLQNDYYPNLEQVILKKILSGAVTLPELQQFSEFTNLPDEVELYELIDELYDDTDLFDAEDFEEMLSERDEDLDDPEIEFVRQFYELNKSEDKNSDTRNGKLNILLPQLMEVKKEWLQRSFIPDANRTVRLTYGYKSVLPIIFLKKWVLIFNRFYY